MSRRVDAGGQASLGDFGRTDPTDRLFFAVFPDEAAALRIAALAQELRAKHGLQGKALRTDRLHVTLHHLGDFPGDLWQSVADKAARTADRIRANAFEIAFDSASSFATRRQDRPFVLRSGVRSESLHDLHARLGAGSRALGNGARIQADFVPHVTLLYDERMVAPEPVGPVSWTVREFVLVRSLLGQTRHERLGRWPLPVAG